MAFRLKLQEDLSEGVRRVALEQVEIAEQKLAAVDGAPTAIHDVRRCLKRLRALTRLLRPALAETVYAREARRLAGIGRALSDERDQQVMRETVAKLEARFGPLPSGAAAQVRKLQSNGARAKGRITAERRREALTQLARVRKFFNVEPKSLSFDAVAEGLEHTYRKGRKAFRHAYRNPNDETMHALRKAVQLHWRHMLLLSRAWTEAMSARAHEARELSRLLGDDHDLAVLVAHLHASSGPSKNSAQGSEALTGLCTSWQSEIRARAQPHCERLFVDRAGDLRDRIETYWHAARRLRVLDDEQEHEQEQAAEAPAAEAPTSPPLPEEAAEPRT
jgi:CHAD domain-containing protein